MIICDNDKQILIKQDGETIGSIFSLKLSNSEAFHAVFDISKMSNHNVRNITFDLVISENEMEKELGLYKVDSHMPLSVKGDYVILTKAQLKKVN